MLLHPFVADGLGFDRAAGYDGDPDAGALSLDVDFGYPDETLEVNHTFMWYDGSLSLRRDFTGLTVTARVKLASGGPTASSCAIQAWFWYTASPTAM